MKTLYIVRHAKSSWESGGLHDVDRPLSEKGVKKAYSIAEQLLKSKTKPDLIISSSAARALHTAVIFTRTLKVPLKKIKVNENLYLASPTELINAIEEVKDRVDTLMMFGHNPTNTFIANMLHTENIENMCTASVGIFEFKTKTWNGLFKLKPVKSSIILK